MQLVPPPPPFLDQAPPTRHPGLWLLIALLAMFAGAVAVASVLAMFAGAAAVASVLRSYWRRCDEATGAVHFRWTARPVLLLALALLNFSVMAVILPEQAALAVVNGLVAAALLLGRLVYAVLERRARDFYKVDGYLPGQGFMPQGAGYTLCAGGDQLMVCLRGPTKREVRDVRDGPAEFALLPDRDVIFFLYRFGPTLGWCAAPYSCDLASSAQQRLLWAPVSEETGALLTVILMDAVTKTFLVERVVTLSPEFTRALHAACRDQAPWPGHVVGYHEKLREACRRYSSTKAMLAACCVRCRGGE